MLTKDEIRGFNEQVPKCGQIQAVDVSWPEDSGRVKLTLTLRSRDAGLRHTRMIVRAEGVQQLRVFPHPTGLPQVGLLEIRDISDRGWEHLSYEVADREQEEAISFFCADLKVDIRTY